MKTAILAVLWAALWIGVLWLAVIPARPPVPAPPARAAVIATSDVR